ncbi:MAG: hypothetical protein AABZ65_04065 [Candidatus Omnitrophota bacterium]
MAMARPYRLQGEGCLYRVPSRGDGRKNIFLSKTGYQNSLHTLKQQNKNNLVSAIVMCRPLARISAMRLAPRAKLGIRQEGCYE